jgi:hypothetical protein
MLPNSLGTFAIDCDAPQYHFVQACRKLGFRTPEDVRWCQESNALPHGTPWHDVFGLGFLKSLIGPPEPRCVCGHKLPALECYSFILRSGGIRQFFLGQCDECDTIFWKDA